MCVKANIIKRFQFKMCDMCAHTKHIFMIKAKELLV